MDESPKQQEVDSDTIFNAIVGGEYKTIVEAKQVLTVVYLPDLSFSRAGVSHALKRLKKHYGEPA